MEALPVAREDVERAVAGIAGRLHRTPLLSCRSLGPNVLLKAELFQRTGSFKPRGVLTKLVSLTPDERERGVIAASAGNHAIALAFAARLESTTALVVMFKGASRFKCAVAEAYGAAVDLEASGPGQVLEREAALARTTGRVPVHPWDDPFVLAGHGTLGLEILEDAPEVETIVVPCGGGGLFGGVVAAAVPSGVEVVPVEPEESPALSAGVAAGRPVAVEARSIADGLNAPRAGDVAVTLCLRLGIEPVRVTEEEVAAAFRFVYERAKLACEPAGAVAVAALLSGKVEARRTVCIVSGGNVASETAAGILTSP